MKFPSKKTFDETSQFTLLPADDYEVIISEVKEDIQNKFNAVPDENGITPQEQVIRCVFDIVSFKDGTPAKDMDGQPAKNRKLFFTGRPESMGWKSDGTPSKTRCLVAYATGQDINEELELRDWSDLVGKTLFVEVLQGKNMKGKTINKISRLILPRIDRDNQKLDKKDEEINVEDLDVE